MNLIELNVIAEELKVDGSEHRGNVSIKLHEERLSLHKGGHELCIFRYKKMSFKSSNGRVPGCMLLQADGLKFVFKCNATIQRSINEAMGLLPRAMPLKSVATSRQVSLVNDCRSKVDEDSNIQNVHPNHESSRIVRGGKASALMDLPKPPSRVANMRSDSSGLKSQYFQEKSSGIMSRMKGQESYPQLQMAGTKSVNVSRDAHASATAVPLNQSSVGPSIFEKRNEAQSSVPVSNRDSPQESSFSRDIQILSPPKKQRDSFLDSVSPRKMQRKADPSSTSRSESSHMIFDRPKISSLPQSKTKTGGPQHLFFPSPAFNDSDDEMAPSASKSTIVVGSKSGTGTGFGSGSGSGYRSTKLTFSSLEHVMANSKNDSSSAPRTYSRNLGVTGSKTIPRSDGYKQQPIQNVYRTAVSSLSKEEQSARDLARAMADSMVTADEEKEKTKGREKDAMQYYSSVSHFFNSTNTSNTSNGRYGINMADEPLNSDVEKKIISKRGRLEGMRNLGNTCYLSSISQALLSLEPFKRDLLCPFWLQSSSAPQYQSPLLSAQDTHTNRSDGIKIDHRRNGLKSPFLQFLELARRRDKGGQGVSDLASLKASMDFKTNQFRGNTQQDAHEFLSSLLDTIHSEMVDYLCAFLSREMTRQNESTHQMPMVSSSSSSSFSTSACAMETNATDEEDHLFVNVPSSSVDITLDIAEECSVINEINNNSNSEEAREEKGSEENTKGAISPLDLTTANDEVTHDSSAMDIDNSDDANVYTVRTGSTDSPSMKRFRDQKNIDTPKTPELAVINGEILAVDTPPSSDRPDTPPLFSPSPPSAPSSSSASSNKDSHTLSQITAENHPPFFSSFIPTARSFHAEVESTFECTSCGFIREPKREYYRDFSVELSAQTKNDKTQVKPAENENTNEDLGSKIQDTSDDISAEEPLILENLLKSFFAEDERELSCESCRDSDSKAKVYTRLVTAPNVLIVHLKRFQFCPESSSFVKVSRPVKFPTLLSLGTDIVSHSAHGEKGEKGDSRRSSLNTTSSTTTPSSSTSSTTSPPFILNNASLSVPSNEIAKLILSEATAYLFGTTTSGSSDPSTDPANLAVDTEDSGEISSGTLDLGVPQYRLNAVVRHIGENAFSGHYICDTLHQTIPLPNTTISSIPSTTPLPSCHDDNNEEVTVLETPLSCEKTKPTIQNVDPEYSWNRNNDSLVTPLEEHNVLTEMNTPYIFFYTRIPAC